MQISDLKHVSRELPAGCKVVVLNTGALINAEAEAMLQALHSRSIGGIDAHLVKLAQKGADDFMRTYYVGYGDKSIGDCGTTTVFIEGVSMLAAKAIQDSMLYNGQEASTRYIDFSKQRFCTPTPSPRGTKLLETLRGFHLDGLEVMKRELAKRHPRQEGEDEKVWQKAINARAFDVMRSFLPAGASTNLAWHTELRHAADHLLRLRHHPLTEVREMAEAIHDALDEFHPNSFKQKRYPATEDYVEECMKNLYFLDEKYPEGFPSVVLERDGIDHTLLRTYRRMLETRPFKAEPPKYLAECGTAQFRFGLDFGSFRDVQRQRAVIQRMPLLTDRLGFEPWYFEQMPPEFKTRAVEFLKWYAEELELTGLLRGRWNHKLSGCTDGQYYIPMGYQVTNRITGDLPALIWLVELRSGISVHPTLRIRAHEMSSILLERYGPDGLVLHIDDTPDRFNYGRGKHDIVEKV